MGIALSQAANPASGAPPAGDKANAVLAGSFTAVGVSQPFCFYGPMNVAIYATLKDALTTTAGSLSASLTSGTGIAVGQAVYSPAGLVPPGTIIAANAGASPTLGLPPGLTAAAVLAGTDNNAIITGAGITFSGTVQLEKSYDGGNTWILCNIGLAGAPAQWTGTSVTPVSFAFGEPEGNVAYRLNCTSYASGTIVYRISQTGQAGMTLSLPALS